MEFKAVLRLLTFVAICIVNFQISIAGGLTDNEAEQFHKKRVDLDEAIERRNFQEAKLVLDDLFPIMKRDIKSSRKLLSQLEKKENPSIDPDQFKENLNRKEELFESMKSLVNISPAALRAKASYFVEMIQQYDILMSGDV